MTPCQRKTMRIFFNQFLCGLRKNLVEKVESLVFTLFKQKASYDYCIYRYASNNEQDDNSNDNKNDRENFPSPLVIFPNNPPCHFLPLFPSHSHTTLRHSLSLHPFPFSFWFYLSIFSLPHFLSLFLCLVFSSIVGTAISLQKSVCNDHCFRHRIQWRGREDGKYGYPTKTLESFSILTLFSGNSVLTLKLCHTMISFLNKRKENSF